MMEAVHRYEGTVNQVMGDGIMAFFGAPSLCVFSIAGSVSYGKATSYLPVIDLLKDCFQVEPRDDTRKIREKVTGKLLSLDRALEPALQALLWLLDVPGRTPRGSG